MPVPVSQAPSARCDSLRRACASSATTTSTLAGRIACDGVQRGAGAGAGVTARPRCHPSTLPLLPFFASAATLEAVLRPNQRRPSRGAWAACEGAANHRHLTCGGRGAALSFVYSPPPSARWLAVLSRTRQATLLTPHTHATDCGASRQRYRSRARDVTRGAESGPAGVAARCVGAPRVKTVCVPFFVVVRLTELRVASRPVSSLDSLPPSPFFLRAPPVYLDVLPGFLLLCLSSSLPHPVPLVRVSLTPSTIHSCQAPLGCAALWPGLRL